MSEHFFIVGAQRSGTTYLYHLLDQHPEIEMAKPVRPEPKFFVQSNLDQFAREDYLSMYFTEITPVRGEKSTSYIELEDVAKAISKWFPDAKIIFLLRNPIDRAISNYKFSRQHDAETLPMREAFLTEETRRDNFDRSRFSASPYAYLQRGRYIDYIRQYERYFPKEQLLIYLFEEVAGSLPAVQNIFSALGVANTFIPDGIHNIVNASDPTQSELMDDELRQYLQEYFADANHELAQYLGRSLEIWDESNA